MMLCGHTISDLCKGTFRLLSYSLEDAENNQCLSDLFRDVVILYTKTICFY